MQKQSQEKAKWGGLNWKSAWRETSDGSNNRGVYAGYEA